MTPQKSTVRHAWDRRAPVSRPVLRHGQAGFTMVELLIVIAIAGVLAAIAIPSMRDMLRDFRQRSALSLMLSDLNLARGEAIKRNARILVCLRDVPGTGCVVGQADWRAGWLVCSDANADGACDVNPTNPIVVRPALDASLTLTGPAAPIRFNANSSQGDGGVQVDWVLGGVWTVATTRLRIEPAGSITKP